MINKDSHCSFAALFFCPESTRYITSLCQQQATGRYEYLDRGAKRRLFQGMPSRSENIWRQASEFTSGKFSQKHLFGPWWHNCTWKKSKTFVWKISWTLMETVKLRLGKSRKVCILCTPKADTLLQLYSNQNLNHKCWMQAGWTWY